jgi:hypothetical protein
LWNLGSSFLTFTRLTFDGSNVGEYNHCWCL